MNEAETRAEHIDPALAAAGWSVGSTLETLQEETPFLTLIYQRKLAALDELKKSLLDQAFRGNFDLKREMA